MKEYIIKKSELAETVKGLYSIDWRNQLNSAKTFRKWSSIENKPLINAIVETGTIPRFVTFLQMAGHPALQAEAAWTLVNIASGTSDNTKSVIDAGAVPVFITLLNSKSPDLREHAVWALGNIAADCPEYRDLVLDHGIMKPLLQLIVAFQRQSAIRNAVWTLGILCRGKSPRPDFKKISVCLPLLSSLLFHHDDRVLTFTCQALSCLTDGSNTNIAMVVSAGVCKMLVELLMHNCQNVVSAALRAVGNIVTGTDSQTQMIIDCSVLPNILHLLKSDNKSNHKEICWMISNITAGTKSQIQAVIDAKIIPSLIDVVDFKDVEVTREAAWVLKTISANGSIDQTRYLIENGCILLFCKFLNVKDAQTIAVALISIENILRCGEDGVKKDGGVNPCVVMIEAYYGVDKIRNLQNHEIIQIRRKAVEIVNKYFDIKGKVLVFEKFDKNCTTC